jgi:hypothetical protein
MTKIAPRYPEALVALILGLDDERQPIAETSRRVGRAAERLGIQRPSYVHVRRIVVRDRLRRRELAVTDSDAIDRVLAEARPEPYRVLGEYPIALRRCAPPSLWLRVTSGFGVHSICCAD